MRVATVEAQRSRRLQGFSERSSTSKTSSVIGNVLRSTEHQVEVGLAIVKVP